MFARLFVLLQHLLPHHLMSRLVGWVAESRLIAPVFIRIFAAAYRVDMTEANREQPGDYLSFNDFFTRELKPTSRRVRGAIASPADGKVSAVGNIEDLELTQVKGVRYRVDQLLASGNVENYRDGSFVTIYLAPHDYHRVHCPTAGKITNARYVPGQLFSVNASTTALVPDLFVRNERLVMDLQSPLGDTSVVMVGAMIVAGIATAWQPEGYAAGRFDDQALTMNVDQGEELGRFYLGSTVILLFPQRHEWKVKPGDRVRFGDALVD